MSDWGILVVFLKRGFSPILAGQRAEMLGCFLSESRRSIAAIAGLGRSLALLSAVGVIVQNSKPTIHEQNRE